MQGEQVERTHQPAGDAHDEHESHDAWLHPEEVLVERVTRTRTVVAARLDRTTIYFVAASRTPTDRDYQHAACASAPSCGGSCTGARSRPRRMGLTARAAPAPPRGPRQRRSSGGDDQRSGRRALFLKHHTTTELVDRAEAGGLLRRSHDDDDHRVVRLHITRAGEAKLTRLSRQHLDELKRLRAGIL